MLRIYYIEWGPLDLAPDEAQYWEWSRRLDLSYYSKGPAIAYIIAFFTAIFGDSELGLRMGAIITSVLLTLLAYIFTNRLFNNERTAFFAALIPNLTPLFSAGSILMTTDSPLLLFWGLAIYTFYLAMESKKMRHWFITGIFIGLGLLSKYTMALIYPSIFLFLLFSEKDRVWLWRKGPYLTLIVSLLLTAPIILWNSQNDWVSFRHVLGQTHVMEGWRFSLKYFFDFLGSQAGLLSPLIFFGLIFSMIKTGREGFRGRRDYLFLFFTSAPVFLFFLLKSLQGKVIANWAAPVYFTGLIAVAAVFDNIYSESFQGITFLNKKKRKVFRSRSLIFLSLTMGLFFTMLTYYPDLIKHFGVELSAKMNPTTRLKGWEELGEAVGIVYADMQKEGDVFIVSDRYQVTSELAFYVPGQPQTYNVNLGRRMNQYDLWGGFDSLKGLDAVYVKWDRGPVEGELKSAFKECGEALPLKINRGGRIIREFFIFRCYRFKGMKSDKFEIW